MLDSSCWRQPTQGTSKCGEFPRPKTVPVDGDRGSTIRRRIIARQLYPYGMPFRSLHLWHPACQIFPVEKGPHVNTNCLPFLMRFVRIGFPVGRENPSFAVTTCKNLW